MLSRRRTSTTAPSSVRRKALAVAASAALLAGATVAGSAPATGSTAASVGSQSVAAAPVTLGAPDVPGRGSTALNLFQWTWDSVAAECTSVIGPAGFAYVQVSPPQEHIQGTTWWTSYQPVSYKLESKLGSRAQFKNMVDTCERAGVGVIADTVINHMTGADVGSGTGTGGSAFGVDHFPGLYDRGSFNDCRTNIASYNDRYQVQNCRLVSLQDLRTGSDPVRDRIAGYLNDLLSLGVAGFRIDASKHIPASDLEAIKSRLTDRNAFWVHEVIGAAGEPIQPSEYLGSGDSHEFQYARNLKNYMDGSIAGIRGITNGLLPSDRAGVFVDNHDTERDGHGTMSYKWGQKYILGNVFMLAYPYGWPTVYSGYKFTDRDAGVPGASSSSVPAASCSNSAVWTCTQRLPEIRGMVKFRAAVGSSQVTSWWDNGNNHIAFGRGDKGYVVINNEPNPVTRTYQTTLPAGQYSDLVSATGATYTVDASGRFTATVPQYGALALAVGSSTPGEPGDPAGNRTTVFYKTPWSTTNIHYKAGNGAWTAAPGRAMVPACSGYASITLDLGAATTATAAFNNGSGTWDNNGSRDYTLSGASVVVENGTVAAGNPCGTSSGTTTVFYPTRWDATNIHFKVGSGAWTAVPGVAMTPACSGWVKHTVQAQGQPVVAAFNNGSGTWDNNGGRDFTLTGAVARVQGSQVSAVDPCAGT